MPIFNYTGYDGHGSPISGELEATGHGDASSIIRSQGVFIESIREKNSSSNKTIGNLRKSSFLPGMTRHLSILLSSGVPLLEAFQSLSRENRGVYKAMLLSIKEKIEGGSSLGRAMHHFRGVFPDFYVNMVEAGEASGQLDRVLDRLADFLEKQHSIKLKIRSSTLYPMIMLSVSIIVLSFLFTFVIPKIVKIFRDTKTVLPFATQVLLFVSNVFVNYWWLLALIFLFFTLYIRKLVRNHRYQVDGLLLKLPGGVMQSLYYGRFARTLSFLIEGGLPMLKALSLAANSMGNKVLEASVVRAEERVAEGQRLSASLDLFPPMFLQLIATGEKSGKLSETVKRAADSYEEDFNRKIDRTVSLFEPAMIVFMGLVVCFIVLAVLLPMFQLNQLVK